MTDTLLTQEEAAALLLEAEDINERMLAKDVHGRKADGPLPAKTICCGELIRQNRGLRMLVWQLYPQLADPEVVEQAIRSATVRGAGGAMN